MVWQLIKLGLAGALLLTVVGVFAGSSMVYMVLAFALVFGLLFGNERDDVEAWRDFMKSEEERRNKWRDK